VPAPADRSIEIARTFAGIKLGEYLGHENRLMRPLVFIAKSRGP
jgi:hypothetical protein